MRLVQLTHATHGRRVALVEEPQLRLLRDAASVYELARSAMTNRAKLRDVVAKLSSDERVSYDEVYELRSPWRLLPPIDHPEPSRCYVTGTGLTHKGSADNRQSMHDAGGKAEAEN